MGNVSIFLYSQLVFHSICLQKKGKQFIRISSDSKVELMVLEFQNDKFTFYWSLPVHNPPRPELYNIYICQLLAAHLSPPEKDGWQLSREVCLSGVWCWLWSGGPTQELGRPENRDFYHDNRVIRYTILGCEAAEILALRREGGGRLKAHLW